VSPRAQLVKACFTVTVRKQEGIRTAETEKVDSKSKMLHKPTRLQLIKFNMVVHLQLCYRTKKMLPYTSYYFALDWPARSLERWSRKEKNFEFSLRN